MEELVRLLYRFQRYNIARQIAIYKGNERKVRHSLKRMANEFESDEATAGVWH